MTLDKIGGIIIDCAIKVHQELGPGLLESCYEICLIHELTKRGLMAERQKELPVIYDGIKLDAGFRIDILVEGAIVIEIKSVAEISNIHKAQLLTYLRLGGYKLGYLLNFNVTLLKNGIRRMIY